MSDTPYFISYNEALEILSQHTIKINTETIHLDDAFNRVLSEELQSKVDDPRFDNSSMDGFAFRHNDSLQPPTTLSIVQTVQAGTDLNLAFVNSGQASRIMTGAPVPDGADSILPIELCQVSDNGKTVTLLQEGKKNFIRKRGENLSLGQVALEKGTLLNPSSVGLCATMGYSHVDVFRQMRIGIISTGDELQLPGNPLKDNEIFESNSFGLASLIRLNGHNPIRYDSVTDTIEDLRLQFDKAALECDLVLTSGGVSMGDWDLVRKLMEEEGDVKFWRVKIRPGSPPLFGYWNDTPLFGLPGNPASSHVVFRMLVAPFLRQSTSGGGFQERRVRVKLAEKFKADQNCLVLRRIKIDTSGEELLAYSTGYQGSGNLHSLVLADGLTLLEPGHSGEQGTWCDALIL